MVSPYEEGRKAGLRSLSKRGADYNPYDYPSENYAKWALGWLSGYEQSQLGVDVGKDRGIDG